MYIVFKSIVLHFAFSSFVVQSLPWSLIRPQLTASITRAGPYTHSTSSLTEAAPGNLTNAATISSLEGLVGGSFELNFNNLPLQGSAAKTPWPSSFFPSVNDGINSPSIKNSSSNPVIKYSQAFGKDPIQLMNLVSRVGGIDQLSSSPGRSCASDSDCSAFNDGSECARRQQFPSLVISAANIPSVQVVTNVTGNGTCVPSWFGICNAWTAASILEDEVGGCPVQINETTFEIMDIKALLVHSYDLPDLPNVFIGERCSLTSPPVDQFGRMVDPSCRDVTPDLFHLVLTNLLGKFQRGMIIDIASNVEVWNQPIVSYKIVHQQSISKQAASLLISSILKPEIAEAAGIFPPNTINFVQVTMEIDYIEEGAGNLQFVASGLVKKFTVSKSYDYLLFLDANGNMLGGEWTGRSLMDHPDFLWLPRSQPSLDSTIAGIRYGDVKMLLAMSRAC